MITGIGVDITTITRIASAHERFGERFERRILHPEEQQELREHPQPLRFLAKRFAVKEAAVKALGTGERSGVLLKDFYLTHDEMGKPLLHCSGRAAEVCQAQSVTQQHVSISDEGDQVVAFVVLERS